MDKVALKKVLEESAELLEKSNKMASLIQELESSESKNNQKIASLEQQLAQALKVGNNQKEALLKKVEGYADRLVEHGSLSKENKVAFLQSINDDPSQIVDVMEKLASQGSVSDLGGAVSEANSKLASDDKEDPLVKWAMGS